MRLSRRQKAIRRRNLLRTFFAPFALILTLFKEA